QYDERRQQDQLARSSDTKVSAGGEVDDRKRDFALGKNKPLRPSRRNADSQDQNRFKQGKDTCHAEQRSGWKCQPTSEIVTLAAQPGSQENKVTGSNAGAGHQHNREIKRANRTNLP